MIRKRGKKEAPGFPLTWACEWPFWCPSVLSNIYSLSHLPSPWVPTSPFRWKILIKELSSTQKEKKKKRLMLRLERGKYKSFSLGYNLTSLGFVPMAVGALSISSSSHKIQWTLCALQRPWSGQQLNSPGVQSWGSKMTPTWAASHINVLLNNQIFCLLFWSLCKITFCDFHNWGREDSLIRQYKNENVKDEIL